MDGGTSVACPVVASDCVVTGYACQLPGAPSSSAFWDLLKDGRSAIGEIGPDRFSTARYQSRGLQDVGTSYSFHAGLLGDIWGFDPGFFGLSPREAKQMDPQQRLLLKVTWEALEHAGLPPSKLARDRTGVYVGASSSDHSSQFYGDPARIDAPFMLGNTLSILSNRISYAFDLNGPSYTVDTACSSSFYALDQARRALDAGEIDTAIVGAVNMLLSPMSFVGFSRAGMLSPNGRCAFLDAGADGYVRAEGAVVFILRRADVARTNGDRIRGRLIATGVNSDGRTNGLALPSADRQAALLTRLRQQTGVTPDAISFVEAHGTGTRAGDLAEATSLGTVYGQERAAPLPLGSAKTNVGHLEPASGLVGLLKAQLTLEHGVLPATLHLSEFSPDIDFGALNIAPVTDLVALPEQDEPWIAAVNSFGFGGANAHALLAGSPASEVVAPAGNADCKACKPLILSAASVEALEALSAKWAARLGEAAPDTAEALINQAAWRRERMMHALVAHGETPADIAAALARHAGGAPAPSVISGTRASTGRTVFAFSGNGAQWPGMGRHLFDTDPTFRRVFSETSELFGAEGGHDLVALLHDPKLGDKLGYATVGQSLLLAVQVALFQSLTERGLTPDAVVGHSVGEVAAAYAAGALSLGDAVRLIQARASVLETLHGTGGMAAVLSGVDALQPVLAEFAEVHGDMGMITLAADNNPRSTTISGSAAALDTFAKFARSRRLAVKRLDVPYPYHSAAVEPLRDELLARIADIAPRETRVDFVSSATGMVMPGSTLEPAYWWLNTRESVLFRSAIETLTGDGCRVFVEIGPRPVLQNYIVESATAASASVHYVPTLDKGRTQNAGIEEIVARAIVAGARHEERQVFGEPFAFSDDLPTYPWQQSQFRAEATSAAVDAYGIEASDHPLLGWRERAGDTTWHNHVSTGRQPWLADHAVGGAVVFPAAGYAEVILAAAAAEYGIANGDAPTGPNEVGVLPALDLTGLDILQPFVIDGTHTLRTTLMRETGTVTVESMPYPAGTTWVLHARGRVRTLATGDAPDRAPLQSDGALPVEAPELYAGAEALGLTYGPAFRTFAGGSVAGDRMVLDLTSTDTGPGGFLLDPTRLDGAMHGLAALIASAVADDAGREQPALGATARTILPVRMGRLQLYLPGVAPVRGALALHRVGARSVKASLTLYAEDERPVARLTDLRLRAMPAAVRTPSAPRYWRHVLEPRDGPDEQVSLPRPWQDPARQAEALGITSASSSEGDAGALIIDAACRRLSWDIIRALADADGRVEQEALGGVHPSARPLLGRMLLALQEDALFERDDPADASADAGLMGQVAAEVDYPAFAELLAGLRFEMPALSNELLMLSGLADQLRQRLVDGLQQNAGGFNGAARSDHAWGALEVALGDLASSWNGGQRLTVLLIGTPPRDVLGRLLDHPALTKLTLSDVDPGRIEVLARDLPRHPALEIKTLDAVLGEDRSRDIMVVADQFCRLDRGVLARLSHAIAMDGLLIGTHAVPDFFGDLIAGQDPNWWSANEAAPVGCRVGARELVAALSDAGIAQASAHTVAGCRPDTHLVLGRGSSSRAAVPAATSDETAPPEVIFHLRQSAAERPAQALREALQTGGAQEVQLSALTPLIGVPDGRWEGVVLLQAQHDDDVAGETAARIDEIQALLARLPAPERLWLILPGGCPGAAQNASESPVMAALWGYGRTLVNEYADLDIRLVDPGAAPEEGAACDAWAKRLARVIASPDAEREILTGPGGVSVPRIEPVRTLDAPTVRESSGEMTRRLSVSPTGGLDSLSWDDAARCAPKADEVEIAVRAAGLNFRDVMWAQGLLPEEALEHGFAGPALGMECAGVVVRAGAESGFAEGERVVAFASQALAGHVTTPASTVARIPMDLEFEAAASVPVVFATAQYALCELARIRPGDRVLIHGGAGGVGLAALQIAVSNGAQVFATAGTPAKRRLLDAFGAEHVFDSRSLSFADEVVAASDGGVDVVLNALAGEAMERSIACLRPFGRFIELGKRDFFADTKIGLYPFHRNLSYFGVDLDELLASRPDEARRLLDAFSEHLATGSLKPPPYQVFQSGDVNQAFRLMQQAGHVGKIVLCPPRRRADAVAPATASPGIRGAWLVVGGTGGFGLETAKVLATRGAEKLWLASRAGRVQDADASYLADLSARGIDVEVLALDATQPDAVSNALSRIDADRTPLTGVVHSAMVLRDRPVRDLTSQDIEAVLAPKIAGAVNLDRATRGRGLDHFVLYSSAVTLFGNPNQAPYVAANMALDRIAEGRRAAGEAALAIGWGAIGDAGYLSREDGARGLLDKMLDGAFLTSDEALDGLARWQEHEDGHDPRAASVSFARMPWPRLASDLAILATPLYDRLDEVHEPVATAGDAAALREELAALDPREALRRVTAILVTEIATVLHQPEAEIDPRRPLGEIGFDSLMAVELRLGLEEKIGLSLPLLSLADATTLTDVAVKILQTVRSGDQGEDGTASDQDTVIDDLISQHMSASDEDLDAAEKAALRDHARDVTSLG